VRRHFAIEPWSPFVEVYWDNGVESYVTPVGPREVGVAMLWSGETARFETLLKRFPLLEKRIAGAPVTSRARGAGPFRQVVGRRYHGPVALVGDAAGYVDALTGEGLSLAFHCARALVHVVLRNQDLSAYEKEYRRMSHPYFWMTDLLLYVAERPRLRSRVIATLARYPDLFDRFLAVSTGERPIYSIGILGTFKILFGLARG
jgi:flavin-dependent dehydrogenase